MEINRDLLKQLDKLDGEQLRRAAVAIAQAMGANRMQAMMVSQNIEAFRARASAMTDSELREAADKIPPDKAAEIMRMLGVKSNNAAKED